MVSGFVAQEWEISVTPCDNLPCQTYFYEPLITFACDVWSKPLGSVVVEEAFGVREPDGEVARVASVLQDSLEGEGGDVGGTVVSGVLNHGRVHAIN